MTVEKLPDNEAESGSSFAQRERAMRRRLIVFGAMSLVVFLCVGLARLKSVTDLNSWTSSYVEQRWSLPTPQFQEPPTFIQFGWDPTQRFYAAISLHQPDEGRNITVVDRLNHRWCTLKMANWTAAKFANDQYIVNVWNQYGWGASTSLNLATWEVVVTVDGKCIGWSTCWKVTPPEVTTGPEPCNPDKGYGPSVPY